MTYLGLVLGKAVYFLVKLLHLGAGGTWPGEAASLVSPDLLKKLAGQIKKGIIIVAGTNGKTTTSLFIKNILEEKGFRVIHNATGANLLNGITSSLIEHASWTAKIKADFAVFEIDENSLPLFLKEITPGVIVCLNLFRDQLDRYGEVDVIAEKWQKAFKNLPSTVTIALNSDDPLMSFLGENIHANKIYFGVEKNQTKKTKLEHATDSIFCLKCGSRLNYELIYYSHLGKWSCQKCGFRWTKPDISTFKSSLPGFYNLYNAQAAAAAAKSVGIEEKIIRNALNKTVAAFGRQEDFEIKGKKIKVFLSKNPAGFNESLKTVREMKIKNLLVILNDNIPDGRDISWIWDVDFENIASGVRIFVSGSRAFEMALRIKYSRQYPEENQNMVSIINENIALTLTQSLEYLPKNETLFILPTYSGMLEVRKIITGRKIL